MDRYFPLVIIGMILLTMEHEQVARADQLAEDKAFLAKQTDMLHDEHNEVRAKAAATIRGIVAKYGGSTTDLYSRDDGESFWKERVDRVKPGMREAEVLKILPAMNNTPDRSGAGSGDSHVVSYRLDDYWMVTIPYRNPDTVIERPFLNRKVRAVYVAPPVKYSGPWVCWYINGQKWNEANYQDGKYDGVLTSYYDNGRKSYEQHYRNHLVEGPDTSWYRDGKLEYTGQYKKGRQDGKWIHWYGMGKSSPRPITKMASVMV